MGDDPVTSHLIRQMVSESLVLFLQPLPLRLKIRYLTGTVQSDPSQGSDRLEETPVLGAETEPLASPLLLVEYRQVAQKDPAIHQRCRKYFVVLPCYQHSVSLGQGLSTGQHLAP